MANHIRPIVPVFVFLQNKDNEVYLQRRANTGYMDGYYDTPSGKVDEGESPQMGAQRELREEAGLHVEEEDLELFHAYLNNSGSDPWLGLMFRAVRWTGEPTICEPHKCDDANFFALDAIPENITQQVRDGLAHLATVGSIEISYYEKL